MRRLGLLAGLVLLAVPASAQAPTEAPEDEVCWRGRPLARCGHFVVTEVGFRAPLDNDLGGTTAIGLMRNVSQRRALGLVLHRNFSAVDDVIELNVRHRWWVQGGRDGIDLWTGPVIAREVETARDFSVGIEGWAVGAGLSIADLLGVTAEIDIGSERPVNVGVRTQSYLTAVPIAIMAVLLLMLVGSYD